MDRSLWAVVLGTFTLRFSTGLTGAMLVYYLDDLPAYGGQQVDAVVLGLFTASFFAAELIFSPFFGMLADRFGYHRIMELGPAFGAVAVVLTGITTSLVLLGATRWLEGASTAASVPAILGFVAVATVGDEGLRGRAVARFEAATLAGLGGGIVAAGVVYTALGNVAFFANALLYGVSWCIYRFGISDPRVDHGGHEHERRTTLARYWEILRGAHVWLLAPTWIAINAVIGLWTAQSIFQLIRDPEPEFADQLLMQGFSPLAVSAGLGVGMVIFFAGLVYWGNRFRRLRRTTIIGYGIAGGGVLAAAALALNHGEGLPTALLAAFVGAHRGRALRPRRRDARGPRAPGRHVRAVPAGPRGDHGALLRLPRRRPDHREPGRRASPRTRGGSTASSWPRSRSSSWRSCRSGGCAPTSSGVGAPCRGDGARRGARRAGSGRPAAPYDRRRGQREEDP